MVCQGLRAGAVGKVGFLGRKRFAINKARSAGLCIAKPLSCKRCLKMGCSWPAFLLWLWFAVGSWFNRNKKYFGAVCW